MSLLEILDAGPDEILRRVLDAAREFEFRSFVIGIERPDAYSRELHDSACRELKIRLGEELAALWPAREVDFVRPELRLEVHSGPDGISIIPHASPLFIGGRYRKLSRRIPACRWMHRRCRGRGCAECNYTGNLWGPSVQELAAPAILDATGGEETFFHGAGREDVDARMLGRGRPFVIEIRQPRKRSLDLEMIAREVNSGAEGLAEISNLAITDREAMQLGKAAAAEKTYRAWIRFEGPAPEDLAGLLAGLRGAEVEQLSPTRVMRRRGEDVLRRKRIIESALAGRDGDGFVWEVRTSSGTYVKELVSGDGGRTRPSVAGAAGVPCRCAALDVLAVHWSPPWETGGDGPGGGR